MSASYRAPGGGAIKVKNLGWFFKKARTTTIDRFQMVRVQKLSERGTGLSEWADWEMIVWFSDGYVFHSDFASLDVFKSVMSRQRSLKGVVVNVVNRDAAYDITLGSNGSKRYRRG